MYELIESLNKKLKPNVTMEFVTIVTGDYELSFNENKEIFCYQTDSADVYGFEFSDSNIVDFQNYLNLDFDILKNMQNVFNDLSFLYSYLFGKTISKNSYPDQLNDLVAYNSKNGIYHYELIIDEYSLDPYIDKLVFTVSAHLNFDLKKNEFFMVYDYKFKNPYDLNYLTSYAVDHKQFRKLLLTCYGENVLNKPLGELSFRDNELLKILNYC